ncbi:MAG: RsiW-degrading membrane proteinase PrsW (M82 family) [Acidimicrobiales bacterium]|jgi:protease PrsW
MQATPPPPAVGANAPGWYADPWAVAAWRWWDGQVWTAHTAAVEGRKPRLPAWLSPPVVVCGVLVALMILGLAVQAPLAIPLGLVPLAIVVPVLLWIDRVEPEPWQARIHALLWGGTVAVFFAAIINQIVGEVAGTTAAAVLSAPIVEEAGKAVGIWYAVRRKELDGVMDGIVYAGWTALGFAVVEDFLYFAQADEGGVLVQVFVLRALLTPFAHPLFTAWTGLAIGRAAASGKPVFPAVLWGYGLAVASHMAWNGSLTLGETEDGAPFLGLSILLFIVLFLVGLAILFATRRKEQKRFIALVPWLAQRYGMAPQEISIFGDWKAMLSARRKLAKPQRSYFDGIHAALARLAHLHDQPGDTDRAREEVLMAQLNKARHRTTT